MESKENFAISGSLHPVPVVIARVRQHPRNDIKNRSTPFETKAGAVKHRAGLILIF